ncbi:MAG: hypothetical protein ACK6DP_17925 [Gemmatimonas sp.]|uniref:hypothetical protein n=1 Tax=Gemmatimonas sp. TaxID=1962908 RepID=UPI00391F7C63|nr:hypothetical protein [Gemmatimonadota bacterium]
MPSSSRSKSLAMLFILGAFLAGGAVGFAAERAVSKPAIPAYDAQQELARELALNDAQRRHVDSVWAWRRARSREIMATVRPALDSVRDSARVLMMNSFDSTQTAAFRRLIERNQRYADSVARARGGKR